MNKVYIVLGERTEQYIEYGSFVAGVFSTSELAYQFIANKIKHVRYEYDKMLNT